MIPNIFKKVLRQQTCQTDFIIFIAQSQISQTFLVSIFTCHDQQVAKYFRIPSQSRLLNNRFESIPIKASHDDDNAITYLCQM